MAHWATGSRGVSTVSRRLTDVAYLPGSDGIKILRRLTTDEMTFLTKEYGVEFAQVYKYGGGQYYLYSGSSNRVQVQIVKDIMFINHMHPNGAAYPGNAEKHCWDCFNVMVRCSVLLK